MMISPSVVERMNAKILYPRIQREYPIAQLVPVISIAFRIMSFVPRRKAIAGCFDDHFQENLKEPSLLSLPITDL